MARQYDDFDIVLEADGPLYRARFASLDGAPTVSLDFPVEEHDLEAFVGLFGKHQRRRMETPELGRATGIGRRLFDALFVDDLRTRFVDAVNDAKRQGRGLRIRLDLSQADDLITLPWEYLYRSEGDDFVALSNYTPLVRRLQVGEPLPPAPRDGPLRVLVMISDPIERRGTLDVEREWTQLRDALAEETADGDVVLTRLPDGRLETLQTELQHTDHHVFHFIGHGEYSEQHEDGVLVLEDARSRETHVPGRLLGDYLRDCLSMRLVVLNNCEGAAVSGSDPFAGSAQSLLRKGLPVVVAMQFEITDAAAIDFARGFYVGLMNGFPVEGALAEARKTMCRGPTRIEFGSPVLYMSAPDGAIFEAPQVEELPRETAPPVIPRAAPRPRSDTPRSDTPRSDTPRSDSPVRGTPSPAPTEPEERPPPTREPDVGPPAARGAEAGEPSPRPRDQRLVDAPPPSPRPASPPTPRPAPSPAGEATSETISIAPVRPSAPPPARPAPRPVGPAGPGPPGGGPPSGRTSAGSSHRRRGLLAALGAVTAIVTASVVVAIVGDGNDPADAGDGTELATPEDTAPPGGPVADLVLLPGLSLGIADRTDRPPTIDGLDDDWTSRFLFPSDAVVHDPDLQHDGPQDLSSVWRLAWDPDFLYLHVLVVDDVLSQTREGASLWRGDAIGMYVDPDRSNDQPGGLLTGEQRSVFAAPTGAWVQLLPDAEGRAFGSDGAVTVDPDVAVAALAHPDGYQLEARIPWRLLGVDDPRPGDTIGMTRDVSDSDVVGADSEQQTMVSNSPGRTAAQQAMPEVWADLVLDAVDDPTATVQLPSLEEVYDRPVAEAQAALEAAGLWVAVSDGGCSNSTQPGDARQVTIGDVLNLQILYGKPTDDLLDPPPTLPPGTPVTLWTPTANPCG